MLHSIQALRFESDDIWCFLEAMNKVWKKDLLNVNYTGLELITSVKSLFPQFSVNSKSSVPGKQHELDHVAVDMDVTTSVTAVQNDVASSTVASSSLASPASQAQKHERQPSTPFSRSEKSSHQYIVRWAGPIGWTFHLFFFGGCWNSWREES